MKRLRPPLQCAGVAGLELVRHARVPYAAIRMPPSMAG
jgi:hypothetical protein